MSDDDDQGDEDDTRPAVSTPPMSERTLRVTLERIETAQQDQLLLEAKRAGAASFRTKLGSVFGGVLTAAIIATFVWVWNAQTTNALQGASITEIERRAHEHDPPPPGHGEHDAARALLDRRVDGIARAQKNLDERFGRRETEATARHAAILAELRRLRTRRQTWGGDQ